MAVKPRFFVIQEDLSRYMSTAGEKGGIATLVSVSNITPGMDDPDNVVAYAADPSGLIPVGMLMTTVEDYNPTQRPANFQNPDIVPLGSKVLVMKKGTASSDMVDPATLSSINADDVAYVGLSGLLTNSTGAGGYVRVGHFNSSADSLGFVTVTVNVD